MVSMASLIFIACSRPTCSYFCGTLWNHPSLCDFIPETEAHSRIYTWLSTSSIYIFWL